MQKIILNGLLGLFLTSNLVTVTSAMEDDDWVVIGGENVSEHNQPNLSDLINQYSSKVHSSQKVFRSWVDEIARLPNGEDLLIKINEHAMGTGHLGGDSLHNLEYLGQVIQEFSYKRYLSDFKELRYDSLEKFKIWADNLMRQPDGLDIVRRLVEASLSMGWRGEDSVANRDYLNSLASSEDKGDLGALKEELLAKYDSMIDKNPGEFQQWVKGIYDGPHGQELIDILNQNSMNVRLFGENTITNIDFVHHLAQLASAPLPPLVDVDEKSSSSLEKGKEEEGGIGGEEPNVSSELQHAPDYYDRTYDDFIKEQFGMSLLERISEVKPISFLENYQLNTGINNINLIPGVYAQANWGSPFWAQKISEDKDQTNPKGQGWKIHISAMPHSAVKIAQLILPKIEGLPSQEGKHVSYKIISTIPHMRTLYSLQYVVGKETQPGKFLVIYPENTQHAYELAKTIDQLIFAAEKSGQLKEQDFQPMIGDATVGYSHQVYVRYGRHFVIPQFSPNEIKEVDEMNITMKPGDLDFWQRPYTMVEDDRFTPWPDFMNKNNETWSKVNNPFQDLPLEWVKDGKKITWETRPKSWLNLSKSLRESEIMEHDLQIDKGLDESISPKLKRQGNIPIYN